MDKPNSPLSTRPPAGLEERDDLAAQLDECQRLVIEMTDTCIQLRAERNQIASERDALAAHQADLVRELSACQSVLHSLAHDGEVTSEYAKEAKRVIKRTPANSLTRRDSRVAAEAMREIAEWMDPDSEKFSGPTYHEAEMIGMEISGPTFCSDARRCMKAGNRAFLEAARIWEYKSRQAEAGAA